MPGWYKMAIHNLRDESIEVSVSAMRHHRRALRKQRLWSIFSFKNGFNIFIKDSFRVQFSVTSVDPGVPMK